MAEEIKATEVVAEEVKADAPKAEEAKAPRGDRKDFRRPRGDKKNDRRQERKEEVKEFEERVVFINRVSKTVKGGRRMKFTALVAIGDHKGRYGFALAKAAEVPDAIKKAVEAAKKNMFKVQLCKGDTLAHEVVGKFGACNVFLKPAPEGTGVIAGGPVRAILELAGIRNVCSKVYGSRAAINIVRATNQGLESLKSYKGTRALRGQAE